MIGVTTAVAVTKTSISIVIQFITHLGMYR